MARAICCGVRRPELFARANEHGAHAAPFRLVEADRVDIEAAVTGADRNALRRRDRVGGGLCRRAGAAVQQDNGRRQPKPPDRME